MQNLLFESAIRATLIAAVIGLVLFAMRIKTASVLHAVWAGVVVVMMLLPAWVAWGPKASLPVLPPEVGQVAPAIMPVVETSVSVSVMPHRAAREPQPSSWNWALGIYLLGVFTLLTRLAIGTLRANRLTSASCVVPITVGFFRPRVILPASSREWTQPQLDAVLTHEGEHARRRDPLFQWLALLNRAIFWFHPLAWWLERRLSGLAEEACDTAVIAKGHDPRDYSEYLLELARSVQRAGTRVSALGMAMPGVGLRPRIRRILSGVPVPGISRVRLAGTAAACAIAATISAAGTLVRAQSAARPVFDVASIRISDSGSGGSMKQLKPGSLTYTNSALGSYVRLAYGVQSYQLTHGPAVSLAEKYDIVAKAAGAVPEPQVKLMLRSLLEDRFKLTFHKETRELPAYVLTVAKGGPRLKASKDDGPMSSVLKDGFLRYSRTSMAYLAGSVLSNLPSLGRPVVDRTGLAGVYDFSLTLFDPGEGDPKGDFVQQMDNGLSTSLKDLGLKLESQKTRIEVMVIDHAEKPSEN